MAMGMAQQRNPAGIPKRNSGRVALPGVQAVAPWAAMTARWMSSVAVERFKVM